MSRGLGQVQRSVLQSLSEQPTGPLRGWVSVAELAAKIHGQPTRSQVESVRRAVKRLEQDGHVETDLLEGGVSVSATRVDLGGGYVPRKHHYAVRPMLCVHLVLSVDDREERNQHFSRLLDNLVELDRKTLS